MFYILANLNEKQKDSATQLVALHTETSIKTSKSELMLI